MASLAEVHRLLAEAGAYATRAGRTADPDAQDALLSAASLNLTLAQHEITLQREECEFASDRGRKMPVAADPLAALASRGTRQVHHDNMKREAC